MKKTLENLPPSSDKDFWGEGEVNLFEAKESATKSRHFPIVQRGPYFVCKGCDFEHTIPADPKKFTVKNGYLVGIDKIKNL